MISLALVAVLSAALSLQSTPASTAATQIGASDIEATAHAIVEYDSSVRYGRPLAIQHTNAAAACMLAQTEVRRGLHPKSLLTWTRIQEYKGPGREYLLRECRRIWGGNFPSTSSERK